MKFSFSLVFTSLMFVNCANAALAKHEFRFIHVNSAVDLRFDVKSERAWMGEESIQVKNCESKKYICFELPEFPLRVDIPRTKNQLPQNWMSGETLYCVRRQTRTSHKAGDADFYSISYGKFTSCSEIPISNLLIYSKKTGLRFVKKTLGKEGSISLVAVDEIGFAAQ